MTKREKEEEWDKATRKLRELVEELEEIFADIREREVNDCVCGLCEYDSDHGIDGCANECPGYEMDDCFKLSERVKAEWLDVDNVKDKGESNDE